MKPAFVILLGIHAVIHLFGFFKAFGISGFEAISEPVSRTFGWLWLAAVLFFAAGLVLYLSEAGYWWLAIGLGVLLSQYLIIVFWNDAKYGTVLNLVILVVAIIGYSTFSFQKKIRTETAQMFDNMKTTNTDLISEESISELPMPVQKWLLNSGIVGKPSTFSVYLEQQVEMLMNPEQKDWTQAEAKQYFTIEPPAFNWRVNLMMNPLTSVVGRDLFKNGKGEMSIKIFSLFPVVNAKNNERVDQATLQRFLAEIVWFPSAALNEYISWEETGDHSARATMRYNGTEGSGIFHFNESGEFHKFVAMRYKDASDQEPTEWTVIATKTEERNGIKIPVESRVNWSLKEGVWTWLKLKVTRLETNVKEFPVN